MHPAPDTTVHLSTAGVSLVLDVTRGRLPAVQHWGAALGAQTAGDLRALAEANIEPLSANVVDRPLRLSVLPEHWTGWVGRPGLTGSRGGQGWSPRFTVTGVLVDGCPADGPVVDAGVATVEVDAVDEVARLALRLTVSMLVGGLVRARARLTNLGDDYTLHELALAFPLPARAREVLDFAGRWGRERVPQRGELRVGVHDRENRKGRTGLDAATVLSVGVPGFGFRSGEVWGVHVGFSGNHRHYAQREFNGLQLVAGGELLLPGEVVLGRDQHYDTPWVYFAHGDGLDQQAARFHDWLRSRPEHPRSPRPVTLNVWEAVEMDHDLPALVALADHAAAVGVERFVLDDGWMLGRRDDRGGLGDWVVDPLVWPDGLHPLVDHVRGLGMEFGLWFEPEMVSATSAVATAHPDWVLRTGGRTPVPARNQQVLDLTVPAAYERVLGQVTALVEEYRLTYVKWDHNRDLIDAGSGVDGTPAVHEQTLAAYRLLAALRRRFPALEIESCSSGGGRVDLGVLELADRVWGSDCIDPLERQLINRWTMQLVPPEMLGSHVGRNPNHSTDRSHRLSFRAGTALFSHFGIEWDLSAATPSDRRDLAEWVALYKETRDVMHHGTLVRADEDDPQVWLYGSVAQDRSSAVLFLAYLGRSTVSPRGRFTIPGLDPDRRYRVRPRFVGQPARGIRPPVWFGIHADVRPELFSEHPDGAWLHYVPRALAIPGTVMSGRALAVAGLQVPASMPDEVVVLEVSDVEGDGGGAPRARPLLNP